MNITQAYDMHYKDTSWMAYILETIENWHAEFMITSFPLKTTTKRVLLQTELPGIDEYIH